jgi:NADH:ubiquinone oxidoreductase subunit 2 (subunit N)
VTGLTILLSLPYLKAERIHLGEYYGFILLALSGMMVMVSSADLLTIYLGTELMSLSLYVMTGLNRSKPRSLEAAAKYFVLGAFSSGILLYGISLLYGVAGSTKLALIASAIGTRGADDPLVLIATILLAAGYALIGFVAAARGVGASGGTPGLASVMIYLTLYTFMTLGAFAVIGMLRRGGVEGEEIDDFAGLAKRQPLAAFLMLVFMASLAGIPPTAGFIGKFYVFMAAVEAGLAWLAAIALIFAVVSAYYYMRVVMVMYMRDPNPSSDAPPHLVTSPALSFVLACAVAGVILFGIFPNPLVNFALQSVLTLK